MRHQVPRLHECLQRLAEVFWDLVSFSEQQICEEVDKYVAALTRHQRPYTGSEFDCGAEEDDASGPQYSFSVKPTVDRSVSKRRPDFDDVCSLTGICGRVVVP